MISLKDVKGQDNAVRYLSNILSMHRVRAGYLFSGPRGVGRALCAGAFITELVGRAEHPDVTWLKPEPNRKIKIDEIRRAREKLHLRPYNSRFSVCVIEDAHLMTAEAANALLKVLEEPPASSLLILITHKRELLLPTVLSRCAEVRFSRLSVEDTARIIMERSKCTDESTARFLARFSQGSPGAALEMIERGAGGREEAVLSMLEGIEQEKEAVLMNWDEEDRGRLIEDVDMLVMILRDVTMGKIGLEHMATAEGALRSRACALFGNYSVDRIHGLVSALIDVKRALEGNVNPKIVSQALPAVISV